MAFTGQIKVLTFNTWGLPWASKDDKLRLRKQAEYFRKAGNALDVALLQEVWTEEYVTLLTGAAAEAGLVHSTIFDGGVLGAGLLVLSRFPITDVAFRPYSVRGEPGALQGEAMSGKGIGYARVQLPYGFPCTAAHLFNTHTHANWVHSVVVDAYLPDVKVPTDTFAPYRTANMLEAVSFMQPIVEAAAAAGELVVAGGDWNVPVDTLEAALLQELLPGLRDAWQLAGHDALDPGGNTCGDPGNVYTGSIIGGYVPERIDLFWTNSSRVLACETLLKVMPDTNLNYSDHYGVLLTASCEVDPLRPAGAKPVVAAAVSVPLFVPASSSATAVTTTTSEGDEHCGSPRLIRGWGAPNGDSRDAQAGPIPPASSLPIRNPAGPVNESKVSPDPDGDVIAACGAAASGEGGARKANRRARLLQLALEQLRAGMAASAACQDRLRWRALLLTAVTLVALAIQLYGIMATTDHWGKRLAAGVAVVVAPVAIGLCLCQVMWMFMNMAVRRGLGQLIRMVEIWERAAQVEAQKF